MFNLRALVAGLMAFCAAIPALATPLTMEYEKTSLGGGVFKYNFRLILDNHDHTWVSGMQWDWIGFGVNTFEDTLKSFDTNGGPVGGIDWVTLSHDSIISGTNQTSGGFNGPTLYLSINGPVLPGWQPVSVGDYISWSGTSTVDFLAEELHWSVQLVDGGASKVNFEVAKMVAPQAVPEPGSLALVLLGLSIGVPVLKRRGA